MLNYNRLSDINNEKDFSENCKYDFKKFTENPDFELDYELLNKFYPIAEQLNLSQENVDLLMELACEMSNRQKSLYEKDEEEKLKEKTQQYSVLFSEDSEIPSRNPEKHRNYMQIANRAYSEFCSPNLKEILKKSGLIYHPELIKMFHKIGKLSQEDTLENSGTPTYEELTPAQILYGKRN